ncbi:MAG: helix-turn-helix transcriptional regulator [Dehalococcoidia bacterium]|nr:helix-turn-helix transcriptional regulator [Dehalococcoidia bacterium]
MEIDDERQRAGLSKAELARRIGMTPSVVRRLFSSKSSNPTLGTVINMAGALGLEVELKRARQDEGKPGNPLQAALSCCAVRGAFRRQSHGPLRSFNGTGTMTQTRVAQPRGSSLKSQILLPRTCLP